MKKEDQWGRMADSTVQPHGCYIVFPKVLPMSRTIEFSTLEQLTLVMAKVTKYQRSRKRRRNFLIPFRLTYYVNNNGFVF